MKVKVSERALFSRLSRHLAKEDIALKKCRFDSRWYNDLGNYYTVHIRTNAIDSRHVDLEQWGRECGVLRDYEEAAY